ncbi:hypothetical protein D3C80_1748060 [compost metagenome]
MRQITGVALIQAFVVQRNPLYILRAFAQPRLAKLVSAHQQQLGCAVFQHVADTLHRSIRCNRQVRSACLQDRRNAYDHLRRTIQRDRYNAVRLHSPCA